MKYINLLLLLGVAACTQQPADRFVLRGTVAGAPDSIEVILRIKDDWTKALDTAYIVDEKFELRGKMDAPKLCRLSLDNSAALQRSGQNMDQAHRYELDFFVENGRLKFVTPHLDSLPRASWEYDVRKEKNYRVKGSFAQDAYYRYQQQTLPLRYAMQELEKKGKQTPDNNKEAINSKLDEMSRTFIRSNDNLAVNLYIAETLKKPAFTYDQAYLDELEQLFVSCRDTCAALKDFRSYLRDAARLVQGSPLQDDQVGDVDGKTVSLPAQMNPDGYTLIDFWASWCIPCRVSLILLREIYKDYGEKIRFVSVSLDQQEADWQKALKEEKLPWPQFRSLPEQTKAFAKQYHLYGIPEFFIVDREGRIVFSGSNVYELMGQLPKMN